MNKRIDKKRKKLITNTSKVKQRFGIRKLTTGVTSVLLGAFLIWGGECNHCSSSRKYAYK